MEQYTPLTPEQQVERLSERKALRRATTASFMGNFVEWFDYAAYGYLATVIALTFFPQTDTTTGLLATFAVFALSFIVRPFGGLVWGHFGDKYGRRSALSWSILIMTVATFCIGMLPTYNQIGLWAPVLLLLKPSMTPLAKVKVVTKPVWVGSWAMPRVWEAPPPAVGNVA